MKRLFVIDRNLFARTDISQSKKQDVPVERPHVSIWLTGMIYVVRSVAAARAVQAPAAVDVTDAQDATMSRALLGFEIGDSLAGILRDLLSAFEGDVCEATLAVNF